MSEVILNLALCWLVWSCVEERGWSYLEKGIIL